MNLKTQRDLKRFRPLPIGTTQRAREEPALLAAAESAMPWAKRDKRLLVAPMSLKGSRLRQEYIEVSEYELRQNVLIGISIHACIPIP